jgi:hypothetical protein
MALGHPWQVSGEGLSGALGLVGCPLTFPQDIGSQSVVLQHSRPLVGYNALDSYQAQKDGGLEGPLQGLLHHAVGGPDPMGWGQGVQLTPPHSLSVHSPY